MKIVTKSEANRILVENPNARRWRFDRAKYAGPASAFVGRDVVDIQGVLAVYPERRQDADGPYVVLRSISLN